MKNNKYILIIFASLSSLSLIAQNPFPELAPVFKDDIVPNIYIKIDQDSLNEIFEDIFSDHHFPATFIFDNGEIRDTVENIGFRLRGNTSRGAGKKSFKISFNTFEKGRQWKKLEKLNLNGEHNDPSVTRSKLGWDLLRSFGVPAPRCNQVHLYLNNQFVGVYANVEQIDEEFAEARFGNKDGNLYKCLWPADLLFKGLNPDVYKADDFGRRTYDLKTNQETDDYSDLANFITILNNTPDADLVCELERVFNVDSYLKAMVFDIVSANWDGPIVNKNNFYLYHNTATDKFEYLPFDIDNTFGIDWFGVDWASRNIYNYADNPERPIYNRIINIPEYRDRFSFYFKTFIEQHLQIDSLTTYLYQKRDLLTPSIANDRFYPRDYGFSPADFRQSFDTKLSVSHVPIGLTEYLAKRRATALEQLVINDINPIIQVDLDRFSNTLQLAVRDDQSIQSIETCIVHTDNSTTCTLNNLAENTAIFNSTTTFPLTENNQGIFYRVIDNQGNNSRFPACEFLSLNSNSTSAISLFINEIMADNENTIADESGAFEDWVEIYNPTESAISLAGLFLSDKPDNPNKWAFPDVSIPAKGFLLIWTDDDEEEGDLHTNFKLSAAGEFIGIFDTEANGFALIDGFEFGEQVADISFGRTVDGGSDLVPLVPSPNATNAQLTSIDELIGQEINIYPNPTNYSFTIDLAQATLSPTTISLTNAMGQVFQTIQVHNASTYTINTTDLPVGIYFIVFDFGAQGKFIRKLVVSK